MQDYKHNRPATNTSNGTGALTPFFTGTLFGIFISFLFYLYMGTTQLPVAHKIQNPGATTTTSIKKAEKPIEKPLDKTKFEFYSILPKQSSEQYQQTPRQKKTPQTTTNQKYILQLGSFKSLQDADGLRAELSLSNYQAKIETVKVKQQKWHRVTLGPYVEGAKLDMAKQKLSRFKPVLRKQ
jgi:cell division protein FtsN